MSLEAADSTMYRNDNANVYQSAEKAKRPAHHQASISLRSYAGVSTGTRAPAPKNSAAMLNVALNGIAYLAEDKVLSDRWLRELGAGVKASAGLDRQM